MRLTQLATGLALAAALSGLVGVPDAAGAGATGSGGATTQAASGLDVVESRSGNYTYFYVHWDGTYAGQVVWSRDPDGFGTPGDAMFARDTTADGKGVEGRLSTGRVASTQGHNSPYTTAWKTGNLTEDRAYGMVICLVRGGWAACDGPYTVYA
jgi:hypothetical protein